MTSKILLFSKITWIFFLIIKAIQTYCREFISYKGADRRKEDSPMASASRDTYWHFTTLSAGLSLPWITICRCVYLHTIFVTCFLQFQLEHYPFSFYIWPLESVWYSILWRNWYGNMELISSLTSHNHVVLFFFFLEHGYKQPWLQTTCLRFTNSTLQLVPTQFLNQLRVRHTGSWGTGGIPVSLWLLMVTNGWKMWLKWDNNSLTLHSRIFFSSFIEISLTCNIV